MTSDGAGARGRVGTILVLERVWDEARNWFVDLLQAPGALIPRLERTRALNAAGRIAENQGDYIAARAWSMEALAHVAGVW